MVHSGYEASAVHDTFGSLRGFLGTVRATFSSKYKDDEALAMLNEDDASGARLRSAGADREYEFLSSIFTTEGTEHTEEKQLNSSVISVSSVVNRKLSSGEERRAKGEKRNHERTATQFDR